MNRTTMRVLSGLALVALTACASEGAKSDQRATSDPNDAQATRPPISIEGRWTVVSIDNALGSVRPPASARAIEIDFLPPSPGAGTRVSGQAGVNRFFGTYAFTAGEGDTGALGISGVGATRMAGPEDAVAFEAALLETLGDARTVTREGQQMVIECGGATVRLTPR